MFFLGKWQTRPRRRYKLDPVMVAELRRYARQEGFTLRQCDQIRHLQQTAYGYGLSGAMLRDILRNLSWYDPAYTPGEPDLAYWRGGSLPVMLMGILAANRRERTA